VTKPVCAVGGLRSVPGRRGCEARRALALQAEIDEAQYVSLLVELIKCSERESGAKLMNSIHIITLGVQDINLSLRFYRDGLGFSTTAADDNPPSFSFRVWVLRWRCIPKKGWHKI
jgi:hypothetical protein